jgi:ferritin
VISEKMEKAINRQLNRELYSAYLYLSMAAYFDSINLKGFANWMRIQAQEEVTHAMKFYNYLFERGGRAIMQEIEAPPSKWKSPLAVFEHTYEHEQKVTGLINDLVNMSVSEKDHATYNFLQWFVAEQVEEESSAGEVVQKLKLVGDGGGLFMLDRELGQRVFTPPPAATRQGGE